MALEDKDKAEKLVTAIASDIAMYQESTLLAACELDNILDDKKNINSTQVWENISQALKPEIDEGRELFKYRVNKPIFESGIYDVGVKEILMKAKKHEVEKKARALGWNTSKWC